MKRILILLLSVFLACTSEEAKNPDTPNILLIVVDDLGWSDLECYGSPLIETPNINNLAAEGIQFNRGYAAGPVCSPTRASIVTGLNPARINLTVHIHGNPPTPDTQKLLNVATAQYLDTVYTIIPEVLSRNGYRTGHIGKWHLGGGPYSPQFQGYDMAYGGSWAGLPNTFFYPFFNGDAYPELKADAKEGDYLTDVLTDKAIEFINTNRDTSFFLALNYYSPHVPIEGKSHLIEKYIIKADSLNLDFPVPEYAAMVESIDENVGRVVATLDSLDLDKNTLIIFISDNGGLDMVSIPGFDKHTPSTVNHPLRNGKGTIYEGGIRGPFIFNWKGTIRPNQKMAYPISSTDIMNTLCAVVGDNYRTPDGMDLLPLLRGNDLPPRKLFMHFPHYTHQEGLPGATLIDGNYKLIQWYENDQVQLFELNNDINESIDLSEKHPEKLNAMLNDLKQWKADIGATHPGVNPDYREE